MNRAFSINREPDQSNFRPRFLILDRKEMLVFRGQTVWEQLPKFLFCPLEGFLGMPVAGFGMFLGIISNSAIVISLKICLSHWNQANHATSFFHDCNTSLTELP